MAERIQLSIQLPLEELGRFSRLVEQLRQMMDAGEVTGGVHGMVRLGTVAVADCMIFGRTAARTALAFKGC